MRLKGQSKTRADVRRCGPVKVREDDLALPLIFAVDTGLTGEIGRFFSYFCSCLKLTFHFVLKRTENNKLFCYLVPQFPS